MSDQQDYDRLQCDFDILEGRTNEYAREAQQLRADLARTREERDDLRVQLSEGTDDVVPYTAHAWRARCRKMIQERNDARAALLNLLAVVHGDGGHYTDEHGISESARDAKDIVVGLRAALREQTEETRQLRFAMKSALANMEEGDYPGAQGVLRRHVGAATDTREGTT